MFICTLCFYFLGHIHISDFNIATVMRDGMLATSMSGTKPYMGMCILESIIIMPCTKPYMGMCILESIIIMPCTKPYMGMCILESIIIMPCTSLKNFAWL